MSEMNAPYDRAKDPMYYDGDEAGGTMAVSKTRKIFLYCLVGLGTVITMIGLKRMKDEKK